MTQNKININDGILHGLFQGDEGVSRLLEQVLNQVLQAHAKIIEELCGTEFSKSTVSDLCKRLDPIVQAWNNRSLQ